MRVLRREYSNLATLLCAGMPPIAVEHLDTHLTTLGISGEMLGGATTQWDRCRSTGMTTFSCPGLDGEWRNMCVPLMVMDHGLVMQGSTLDDLLHIVAWSLRFYAMGTFPIARYDGSVWLPSDVWRWKRAGKPKGMQGAAMSNFGRLDNVRRCVQAAAAQRVHRLMFQALCDIYFLGDASWRRERLNH